MTFARRMAPPLATALALALAAAAPALAAGPPQGAYMDNCSACHMANGKGVKGAFPALAGSPLVQGDPVALTATVLNGRAGMPAFKDDINDADMAAILTYIRTSWGNKAKPIAPAEVAKVRKAPPKARGLQAH